MAQEKEQNEKNTFKVYIPLIMVVALVLGGGWYWYRDNSKYISTDDAYIDADKVALGSKILGRLTNVTLAEGDSVKKGMVLAEIDSTELVAQKKQTQAIRSQADASIAQAQALLRLAEDGIKTEKINVKSANDDAARGKSQFDGGVITKEQYEHIQKASEAAQAKLNSAETQREVAKAQIATAQAAIATAQAQIGSFEAQLRNTKLMAPFDGIVSKRWLMVGDIVQPGQSVYTITNDKKHWVTIYIEETNLGAIYIGQQAIFSIDAFAGAKFNGTVFYVGANTASQFSLIPPSNASGNFTKTTQRVPVKISIDKAFNKDGETAMPHLVSGMSVIMKLVKK